MLTHNLRVLVNPKQTPVYYSQLRIVYQQPSKAFILSNCKGELLSHRVDSSFKASLKTTVLFWPKHKLSQS